MRVLVVILMSLLTYGCVKPHKPSKKTIVKSDICDSACQESKALEKALWNMADNISFKDWVGNKDIITGCTNFVYEVVSCSSAGAYRRYSNTRNYERKLEIKNKNNFPVICLALPKEYMSRGFKGEVSDKSTRVLTKILSDEGWGRNAISQLQCSFTYKGKLAKVLVQNSYRRQDKVTYNGKCFEHDTKRGWKCSELFDYFQINLKKALASPDKW